jgi:hypothetical protein
MRPQTLAKINVSAPLRNSRKEIYTMRAGYWGVPLRYLLERV